MSRNSPYIFSDTEESVLHGEIKKLESYMQAPESKSETTKEVIKNRIYEILTKRPGFQKKMGENSNFLVESQGKLQDYRQYYQEQKAELEKMLPTSSNMGWFQVNCTNLPKNDEKPNLKIYKTFHPFELKFLKHLPQLHEELKRLGEEKGIRISFKIPYSYSAFYAGSDNLVVHFSTPDRNIAAQDIAEVQQLLDNWLQENNLQVLPRDFGRTELAADTKDSSFSEYIASYYALQAMTGKYSAESILRGAINASQKQNFTSKA